MRHLLMSSLAIVRRRAIYKPYMGGLLKSLNQRRQSGLKTGRGVVGPGLKIVGSWVLKIHQKEVRNTGYRISPSKFFIFMYANLSIHANSPLFESVLISYLFILQDIIIFHGDPTTHPKSG